MIQYHVLLVEDSDTTAEKHDIMLRRAANGFGVSVERVSTLAEAIERAGEAHCVFLDLTLPDSKAEETVSRFREAHRLVPVFVLTADESVRTHFDLGLQGVGSISKDASEVALLSILANQLGKTQRALSASETFRQRLEPVG